MKFSDYHCHSTFCDGKNTPEEMVLAAIEKGMPALGLSSHSCTPFDLRFCMKPGREDAYIEEILRLKEKYQDEIQVLLGTEQDYQSEVKTDAYDYIIGSVHYLKHGETMLNVDKSADAFVEAVETEFGGDPYAYAALYYDTIADIPRKTSCRVIGHFDYITVWNDRQKMFEEDDPRYIEMAREAVDRLIPQDIIFEVNTGGMARGFRPRPYPDWPLIDYINEKGGRFLLTSDSHCTDTLCFGFPEVYKRLQEMDCTVLEGPCA